LVVDDASPGAAVASTAAEFAGVRVTRLAKRGGFCIAANAGLSEARAAVGELLNDDTEVTAGWADAAISRFADSEVVAVAPLVLRWRSGDGPAARIDSAGDDYDVGGFASKRGHGESLSAKHSVARQVFGASASSAF